MNNLKLPYLPYLVFIVYLWDNDVLRVILGTFIY